jgi:hypothetical protein
MSVKVVVCAVLALMALVAIAVPFEPVAAQVRVPKAAAKVSANAALVPAPARATAAAAAAAGLAPAVLAAAALAAAGVRRSRSETPQVASTCKQRIDARLEAVMAIPDVHAWLAGLPTGWISEPNHPRNCSRRGDLLRALLAGDRVAAHQFAAEEHAKESATENGRPRTSVEGHVRDQMKMVKSFLRSVSGTKAIKKLASAHADDLNNLERRVAEKDAQLTAEDSLQQCGVDKPLARVVNINNACDIIVVGDLTPQKQRFEEHATLFPRRPSAPACKDAVFDLWWQHTLAQLEALLAQLPAVAAEALLCDEKQHHQRRCEILAWLGRKKILKAGATTIADGLFQLPSSGTPAWRARLYNEYARDIYNGKIQFVLLYRVTGERRSASFVASTVAAEEYLWRMASLATTFEKSTTCNSNMVYMIITNETMPPKQVRPVMSRIALKRTSTAAEIQRATLHQPVDFGDHHPVADQADFKEKNPSANLDCNSSYIDLDYFTL